MKMFEQTQLAAAQARRGAPGLPTGYAATGMPQGQSGAQAYANSEVLAGNTSGQMRTSGAGTTSRSPRTPSVYNAQRTSHMYSNSSRQMTASGGSYRSHADSMSKNSNMIASGGQSMSEALDQVRNGQLANQYSGAANDLETFDYEEGDLSQLKKGTKGYNKNFSTKMRLAAIEAQKNIQDSKEKYYEYIQAKNLADIDTIINPDGVLYNTTTESLAENPRYISSQYSTKIALQKSLIQINQAKYATISSTMIHDKRSGGRYRNDYEIMDKIYTSPTSADDLMGKLNIFINKVFGFEALYAKRYAPKKLKITISAHKNYKLKKNWKNILLSGAKKLRKKARYYKSKFSITRNKIRKLLKKKININLPKLPHPNTIAFQLDYMKKLKKQSKGNIKTINKAIAMHKKRFARRRNDKNRKLAEKEINKLKKLRPSIAKTIKTVDKQYKIFKHTFEISAELRERTAKYFALRNQVKAVLKQDILQ